MKCLFNSLAGSLCLVALWGASVGHAQTTSETTDDALSIISLVPSTSVPSEQQSQNGVADPKDNIAREDTEDEIGDLISLVDAVQDEDNNTAPSDANLSLDNQTDASQIAQDETETATAGSLNTDTGGARITATPLNRIGRRQVSQVGLATIGLSPDADLPPVLNSMIWSKTQAKEALFLIQTAPPISSSHILGKLADTVITLAALPPEGSENMVEDLVLARLNWLANSGQSDKLSQLTRLLPEAGEAQTDNLVDDSKWASYKQWQVDYDLIRRADDSACKEAIFNAQQSLDSFWHKARIACFILEGDTHSAGFAADILADILSANGEEDTNFFMLADMLLGRTTEADLDLANLNPLHLILMDAAHQQISLEAFETLPASMIQASSSFRYLATNAALKTSYDSYVRGLVSAPQTQTIWRAVSASQVPAEAALADVKLYTQKNNPRYSIDGLASAYLWVGLANRSAADTDLLISEAFKAEVEAGRASRLLPFYAQLIALRTDSAEKIAALTAETRSDFALITALHAPFEQAANITDDDRSAAVRNMLIAEIGTQISGAQLNDAQATHLWPILAVKGAEMAEQDWMETVLSTSGNSAEHPLSQPYVQLPLAELKALQQASEKGAVAETVLLAARLVSELQLGWIAPDDLTAIITSLKQIGLHDEADQFAQEALQAHLLRKHLSAL